MNMQLTASDQFTMQWGTSSNGDRAVSAANKVSGAAQLVIGTFDFATKKTYLKVGADAWITGTTTGAPAASLSNATLSVGRDAESTNYDLDGRLADLLVYDIGVHDPANADRLANVLTYARERYGLAVLSI